MHRSVGWIAMMAIVVGAGLVTGRGPAVKAQAIPGKSSGVLPDRTLLREVVRAVDQGLTYIPGRVIVKFQDGATDSMKSASLSGIKGARLSRAQTYADIDIVEIADDEDPATAAATLASQAGVEYAEPDGNRFVSFTPNDPSFSRQWNMTAINMPQAWDINRGGSQDVIVAVLDTGIAFETDTFRLPRFFNGSLRTVDVPVMAAPDLTTANRFVTPHDFVWDDDEPVDFDGHGTHVAGTIAESTDNNLGLTGIAFNARLMPVKVCASAWDILFLFADEGRSTIDPDFSSCPDSLLVQGIRYAADHGAKVINISLGGPGSQSRSVGDALRYAIGKGVFISIAAGNEFEEGNPVSQPASFGPDIAGVMAVGAVGRDLQRAFYSNTGSYLEIAAPGGNSRNGGAAGVVYQQTINSQFFGVNVLAPRFDVFFEGGFQGTSMAAPHVSGLAALLVSQGISDPAAIEAAIRHFATDKGAAGRDDEYGDGVINARATLRGLGLLK
jgi:serine protease